MKVSELIEKLQQFDPETRVAVYIPDVDLPNCFPTNVVEEDYTDAGFDYDKLVEIVI